MNNTSTLSKKTVSSDRILYTASTFAKEDLIYLQEIGTLDALEQHISQRQNLDSYLFFIVLEGKGELGYDNNIFNISKGDCIFIDCKKAYFHATSNFLWKLQWVHFNGSNLPGIYKKYSERGGQPVFHPKSSDKYSGLLALIYKTAISNDYLRDMRLNELLSSLLTSIMEMSWAQENKENKFGSEYMYSIQEIKDYIDNNYKKRITLDDLSNRFYINKFYMIRLFKRHFDITIVSYILYLRITNAKKLLRFSNQSIENISLDCGFKNANYFSRSFKKVEGFSPVEYRKTWLNAR